MPKTAAPDELRIEYVRLSDLTPTAGNPKDHDLGELGRSFSRFGFVSPIIIDEKSGNILAGHGRREELANAKARGEKAPARIKVDGDGEWMVPVVRGISLDPQDAKAYVIADNRLVEIGGWIVEDLAKMLEDLVKDNPNEDLAGTGYDRNDLDEMLGRMAPDAPGGGGGSVLQFNITFQTQDQKDAWYAFIRHLEGKYGDEGTLAARLKSFVLENQLNG